MPEQSVFEVEMTIEKLKRHKSPSIDKIPAELINAEFITFRSEIHKHTSSVWNKEELPEEWKKSIIIPIYKKGDKTDCSHIRTKFYSSFSSQSYLHMQTNYCGSSLRISTQHIKY